MRCQSSAGSLVLLCPILLQGLLALGNVIAALTDERRRLRGGGHVPYRESKLTRMLQVRPGNSARVFLGLEALDPPAGRRTCNIPPLPATCPATWLLLAPTSLLMPGC